MKILSFAPANIALIKYMGKINKEENNPSNSSLSLTLNNLKSFVEIQKSEKKIDEWEPLEKGFSINPKGQQRFLNHLLFLKSHFKINDCFLVKSYNNFPDNCGLASSASSFAALTLAFHQILEKMGNPPKISIEELSLLSKKGSGSSCRSFFSPWALWDDKGVHPLTLPPLLHQVVVVQSTPKKVSSSEAHQRILSSPLYEGRAQRAMDRLKILMDSLKENNWKKSFQLVWSEFWDMHALFETSLPPFGYMIPDSIEIVQFVRDQWDILSDGPLVTMDAGPNVHLLYREDQLNLFNQNFELLKKKFSILKGNG